MSQPESSSTPISFFVITSQSQQQTMNSQALRPINNNNNNSRRSSPIVRCLIVAILLLFVIVRIADFIAWRVYNPLPPVFQVNEISPLNSTLNKEYCYRIVFLITNPNKNLSLLIDRLRLIIIALQGKTKASARDSMALPANVSAYVEKNSRRDFHVYGRMPKLNGFLQKEKEVNMSIQVNFTVRFLAWNWLPKREFMRAECRNLSIIGFLSAKGEGDLINESQCSVQKHV